MSYQHSFIMIGAIAIITALLAGLYLAFDINLFGERNGDILSIDESKSRIVMMRYDDVFTKAHENALQWRQDAELSQFSPLGKGNESGEAESWRFVFVSPTRTGKGYAVNINGSSITSEEFAYEATGAPMPENAKTPEEAVREIRLSQERSEATVYGVEAVYNTQDRVWYWGVMTDKGVISVKMEK